MSFPQKTLISWLAALHSGKVAAAPAEGAYGYVADPFNPAALEALVGLKGRSPAKGFIVLISHMNQLEHVCAPLGPNLHQVMRKLWFEAPADAVPVTILLPAKDGLPGLLTGNSRVIAVRFPRVAYMQEYLEAWAAISPGPLVSTSLNRSGELPATRAAQLPPGIAALPLAQDLSGEVSRIYNPFTAEWVR